MAEAEVGLRASLKDRVQTAAGLKAIKGDVQEVGRAAQTTGRQAAIGARGFEALRKSGRLAGLAIKAGFGLALTAGYATVRLLKASFDEARESQKVGARTINVLKTTGHVANITARQVGKLSTAISLKSGIDDEAIQTGANLILTFKNIRNEVGKGNDVFNQATQAAVDLSAAGFGSIDSASKMIGKALNDPIKGLTAMGRAGVTFTADQTKRIEDLVAQNKLLDAQKIILGEIQSQVGGAAAAQATWGEKAKVLWQNVEENIGTALLPLLDSAERWFVRTGGPKMNQWVGDFQSKGVPAIRDFLKQARPLAEQVLPAVGTTLGIIRDALQTAAPYAVTMVKAFNDMPSWAKKTAVGASIATVIGAKTGLLGKALGSRGGSGILGAVTSAKPVPVFVTNPGFGGVPDGPGGPGGKLGKYGTALLAPEVLLPTIVAALGAKHIYDSYKTRQDPSFVEYDRPGAPQHAAGSSPAGTAALTAPTYDFNQMLAQQKLASKYQFDFNTELQRTRANIDTASGRATFFGGILDKIAQPVTTPVSADTSGALRALKALDAFRLADKWIHVHLDTVELPHLARGGPVQAGQPYVVGEHRPELFVPNVSGRIMPRVPDSTADWDEGGDLSIGDRTPRIVQLVVSGKVLGEVLIDDASSRDARR